MGYTHRYGPALECLTMNCKKYVFFVLGRTFRSADTKKPPPQDHSNPDAPGLYNYIDHKNISSAYEGLRRGPERDSHVYVKPRELPALPSDPPKSPTDTIEGVYMVVDPEPPRLTPRPSPTAPPRPSPTASTQPPKVKAKPNDYVVTNALNRPGSRHPSYGSLDGREDEGSAEPEHYYLEVLPS